MHAIVSPDSFPTALPSQCLSRGIRGAVDEYAKRSKMTAFKSSLHLTQIESVRCKICVFQKLEDEFFVNTVISSESPKIQLMNIDYHV